MKKIKQGAVLMIKNSNNEFLILKKGSESRYETGKWELCGGAVDKGEDFSTTAVREAKEELGINVILHKELLHEIYSDMGDGVNWEVMVFEATTSDEPNIMEPNKCTELRWVTKQQLIEMKKELAVHLQEDLVKLGWIN